MEKGARTGKGRVWEVGAAWGGHARPSGAYARSSNGGRGPRHVGGVGAYARARQWGAHGSKEGRLYVLPSSLEFAKPSPPGSLPST
jgi:hypothetical protein